MSSLPAIAKAIGPHCRDCIVRFEPSTNTYRAEAVVSLSDRDERVMGEFRTTPALTLADFERDILAGRVRVPQSNVVKPLAKATTRGTSTKLAM